MDPFRFRACACPGTPHDGKDGRDDGDTVTFRPSLPFASGIEAIRRILDTPGDTEVHAINAMPVYVRDGPLAWNLLDAEGEPVPLTHEALDALPFADQYEIGDRGDTLYGGEVLAPLLQRITKLSGNGRTGGGSPRRKKSSSAPRSQP